MFIVSVGLNFVLLAVIINLFFALQEASKNDHRDSKTGKFRQKK